MIKLKEYNLTRKVALYFLIKIKFSEKAAQIKKEYILHV